MPSASLAAVRWSSPVVFRTQLARSGGATRLSVLNCLLCRALPAPSPPPTCFLPAQDAGGQWRYQGGESHLESIPTSWRYADLMHRLAERCNGAVALKYFEPNDEMHPDNLLTVSDDDDLKVRSKLC